MCSVPDNYFLNNENDSIPPRSQRQRGEFFHSRCRYSGGMSSLHIDWTALRKLFFSKKWGRWWWELDYIATVVCFVFHLYLFPSNPQLSLAPFFYWRPHLILSITLNKDESVVVLAFFVFYALTHWYSGRWDCCPQNVWHFTHPAYFIHLTRPTQSNLIVEQNHVYFSTFWFMFYSFLTPPR